MLFRNFCGQAYSCFLKKCDQSSIFLWLQVPYLDFRRELDTQLVLISANILDIKEVEELLECFATPLVIWEQRLPWSGHEEMV